MLPRVQEDAAHHCQKGLCHCQRAICVVSAGWLGQPVQVLWEACREGRHKVRHKEGCWPAQACPGHGHRVIFVRKDPQDGQVKLST